MWNRTTRYFFYFIFLFFLMPVAQGNEFNCRLVEFKINGENKSQKQKLCFSKNKRLFFSEKCRSSCDIWTKIKTSNAQIRYSTVGTVSSNLCHEIGALPYFITFKLDLQSIEKKVCYSKKDNSFVDEETLILKFNKKISDPK